MPVDRTARSASSGSSRRRARKRAQVPRRAHHDGPRRRRQGDAELIEGLFVPAFGAQARRERRRRRSRSTALALAITTDSFVVKPLRFPGGSIGELAVNGTVNDLAVVGRAPAAR